jgi:hypothetical protein
MRLAEGRVMQDTAMVPRNSGEQRPASPPVVDPELADQLLGKAQAEGVELLGPDGLLSQVTKTLLERALAEEMTGHLGYELSRLGNAAAGTGREGPQGGPWPGPWFQPGAAMSGRRWLRMGLIASGGCGPGRCHHVPR